MTKLLKKTTALIVLIIMTATLTITAVAMDFSVTPEYPENQRDINTGFYDLMVYPGQEQNIYITVANITDADIIVLIEAITASSAPGGHVNYSGAGAEMDVTLRHSIEDMLVFENSHELIPANSERRIAARLTAPNEAFDGAILGSISVTREITEAERQQAEEEGTMFLNQFSFIQAIRLVQSDDFENIPVDFALRNIDIELINRRAGIVANIRNPQPLLVKDASITGTIYPAGTDEVYFELTMPYAEFAPNSIFPFTIMDEGGFGIEAGDYTAVITVEHGGNRWTFEENFTIESQVAAEINEGALNLTGEERTAAPTSFWDTMPTWLLVILGIVLILVLVLIIVMIMAFLKKQQPVDIGTLLNEYEKHKANG